MLTNYIDINKFDRVPILGIPMIIDQKQNLLKLMKWGTAEMVQFTEISVLQLTELIIKMMSETR